MSKNKMEILKLKYVTTTITTSISGFDLKKKLDLVKERVLGLRDRTLGSIHFECQQEEG